MTTKTTFRALAADFLPSLDVYRLDPYGDGPEGVDPRESVPYRHLDPAPSLDEADAATVGVLVGSDYSGGALVRANIREAHRIADEIEEETGEAPPVLGTYGGHGTDGFLVLLDRPAPEEALAPFVDLLRGLLDYPAVSDEALSEQEHEEEGESWESYARSDFETALRNRCGAEDLVEIEEEGARVTLRELFDVVAERENLNGGPGVIHEETGPYFMVEEAAAAVSPVLLFALGLARIDGDEALRLAAEEDEEARDEARRVRRLRLLGSALGNVRKAAFRAFAQEQQARRDADPGSLSSVSTRAQEVEEGEAARVALETLLRAEIDAGDDRAPIDAATMENETLRGADVLLVRFAWGPGLACHKREVRVRLDPARSWQGPTTDDLRPLFVRPEEKSAT